jgi:hypothetical protein
MATRAQLIFGITQKIRASGLPDFAFEDWQHQLDPTLSVEENWQALLGRAEGKLTKETPEGEPVSKTTSVEVMRAGVADQLPRIADDRVTDFLLNAPDEVVGAVNLDALPDCFDRCLYNQPAPGTPGAKPSAGKAKAAPHPAFDTPGWTRLVQQLIAALVVREASGEKTPVTPGKERQAAKHAEMHIKVKVAGKDYYITARNIYHQNQTVPLATFIRDLAGAPTAQKTIAKEVQKALPLLAKGVIPEVTPALPQEEYRADMRALADLIQVQGANAPAVVAEFARLEAKYHQNRTTLMQNVPRPPAAVLQPAVKPPPKPGPKPKPAKPPQFPLAPAMTPEELRAEAHARPKPAPEVPKDAARFLFDRLQDLRDCCKKARVDCNLKVGTRTFQVGKSGFEEVLPEGNRSFPQGELAHLLARDPASGTAIVEGAIKNCPAPFQPVGAILPPAGGLKKHPEVPPKPSAAEERRVERELSKEMGRAMPEVGGLARAAQGSKGGRKTPAKPKTPAAAVKRIPLGSTAYPARGTLGQQIEELKDLPRHELMDIARNLNVPMRSQLDSEQLAMAIACQRHSLQCGKGDMCATDVLAACGLPPEGATKPEPMAFVPGKVPENLMTMPNVELRHLASDLGIPPAVRGMDLISAILEKRGHAQQQHTGEAQA